MEVGVRVRLLFGGCVVGVQEILLGGWVIAAECQLTFVDGVSIRDVYIGVQDIDGQVLVARQRPPSGHPLTTSLIITAQ